MSYTISMHKLPASTYSMSELSAQQTALKQISMSSLRQFLNLCDMFTKTAKRKS